VKHNPINQISINGIRKKDGSKNTTKKTMCRESSEKKKQFVEKVEKNNPDSISSAYRLLNDH